VKRQLGVYLVQLFCRQAQCGTVAGIFVIRIGNHGVEAVIASGELNYYQDPVSVGALYDIAGRGAKKEVGNSRGKRRHG
jgi:hypothetical protein